MVLVTNGKLRRGETKSESQTRAMNKETKHLKAGNTLNDIIITESSKLGVEGWSLGSSLPRGGCSRKPKCGAPSAGLPDSPARLPAICLPLRPLLLCISMMLHFPHSIYILYTCGGECYWKCHLVQNCETTNADWVYQQLQFTQSSNWGAFSDPSALPYPPQTSTLWKLVYTSYNKLALNINAHCQCIRHSGTVWMENLKRHYSEAIANIKPCCFYH